MKEKVRSFMEQNYFNFTKIDIIAIAELILLSGKAGKGQLGLLYKKSRFSFSIKIKGSQKVVKCFYLDSKRYQRLSIRFLSESSEFRNISEDMIKADYQRTGFLWIELIEICMDFTGNNMVTIEMKKVDDTGCSS
jgi:hypothetical protein